MGSTAKSRHNTQLVHYEESICGSDLHLLRKVQMSQVIRAVQIENALCLIFKVHIIKDRWLNGIVGWLVAYLQCFFFQEIAIWLLFEIHDMWYVHFIVVDKAAGRIFLVAHWIPEKLVISHKKNTDLTKVWHLIHDLWPACTSEHWPNYQIIQTIFSIQFLQHQQLKN